MQHPIIRMTVVAALASAPLATAQLKVDFNSLVQWMRVQCWPQRQCHFAMFILFWLDCPWQLWRH